MSRESGVIVSSQIWKRDYPGVADLTQRPDTARASLTIRRAIRGDVPAIVGLLASDGLGGHADTTDPEALPDYFDAFDWITAQASTALFVAVLGNEVVGTFQTDLAARRC